MTLFSRMRQHELLRMLAYLQPTPTTYIGLLLLDALNVAILLNIILAFILKNVVDAAIQGDNAALQRAFFFAILALFIGVPAGCYIKYRINAYTRKTLTVLRQRTFHQLINLPLQRVESQHSGDLLSRMTNDLGSLHEFYSQRVGGLIFVSLYAVIVIGAIFRLDWRFGLISLLLGLVTTRISTWFIPPIRRLSDSIQAALGLVTERLVDLLQGARVTKLFQIEAAVHQRYTAENHQLTSLQLQRARWDSGLEVTDFVFGRLKSVGLLALGLYLLLRGYPIQVGTIAAIIYLQTIADYIFRDFGNVLTELQKSLAGARRILALLDSVPELPPAGPFSDGLPSNGAHSHEPADPTVMVTLQDIRFDYIDDGELETTALRGVTLQVGAGRMVALVGPSGGGKSTLLKLLLGFYPPKAGKLTMNGRSSDNCSLADWRAGIAYVSQEAYLFTGTIADNIRYGKPTATQAEIIAAAQAANAHVFIMAQPQGYATLIGERGATLSGGQRQRIAIARALLKDAPILLLDEATSALDSESEQQVQVGLTRLMQGRTTIAVAHRLSTIQNADAIYVMEKGAIVEQGSHQDLLGSKGLYHQLYHAQFRAEQTAEQTNGEV